METDEQAAIELSELSGYGSKAGTSNGLAISLNRVFEMKIQSFSKYGHTSITFTYELRQLFSDQLL